MDPLFLGLAAVAVVGLFFMSSRGRKQQAKVVDFRNTLEPGQEVMTSSGQLGTIVEVEGEAVVLETTPGVRTRWVKAAIQAIPAQYAGARTQQAESETELDDDGEALVETDTPADAVQDAVTDDDPRSDRSA